MHCLYFKATLAIGSNRGEAEDAAQGISGR